MDRSILPLLLACLTAGCFNPNDADDGEAGTAGTGSSGSPATTTMMPTTAMPGDSGDSAVDSTGPGGTTAAPPGTSDDAGVTTDTTAGDETVGICDDVTAPCGPGEYCVQGACAEPPEGMVAVPAGPFMMGCDDTVDSDCDADEFPEHEVTLAAFALDRNEVTVAQYEACMAAEQCTPPVYANALCSAGPGFGSLPINCVSWLQSQAYCASLGKRLPTEAEWEKAARGTDGRIHPWGNTAPTCNQAVHADCDAGPVAVGSRPAGASPYGALDMAGNIYEWVFDWYAPGYYVRSPADDPQGPGTGETHSARGGNWQAGAHNTRASDRGASDTVTGGVFLPEGNGAVGIGFRCAADPR